MFGKDVCRVVLARDFKEQELLRFDALLQPEVGCGEVHTRPSPWRLQMPMAAVASECISMDTGWLKSLRTDFIPRPSAAAFATAANSDSPEDKAMSG